MTPQGPVPLARVPWNEPGIIGKALDAAAMGIICPLVNTAGRGPGSIVAAMRYPPLGSRSHGAIRAGVYGEAGTSYKTANDDVVCMPMIETEQAVRNIDAILDVPGIDAVYVGPGDLGLSMGLPPALDREELEILKSMEDGSLRVPEAQIFRGHTQCDAGLRDPHDNDQDSALYPKPWITPQPPDPRLSRKPHYFPPIDMHRSHRGYWHSCGNCHRPPHEWEPALSTHPPAPRPADINAQDSSVAGKPNRAGIAEKFRVCLRSRTAIQSPEPENRANASLEIHSQPDPSHERNPLPCEERRAGTPPTNCLCRFDFPPFDTCCRYAGRRSKVRRRTGTGQAESRNITVQHRH